MIELRDWIQLALSVASLTAIIIGALKVIHIAQRGVESHERRITNLEKDHAWVDGMTLEMGKLTTRVDEMKEEVQRMRDRLDKFLDPRH